MKGESQFHVGLRNYHDAVKSMRSKYSISCGAAPAMHPWPYFSRHAKIEYRYEKNLIREHQYECHRNAGRMETVKARKDQSAEASFS